MNLLNTWFIKITHYLTKLLKGGNGFTFPGYLLLHCFPNVLYKEYIYPKKGLILVTGTNGKTSTSKLIAHILSSLNYKVLTNPSGSNLLRGLVTSIFLDTSFFGVPKSDIGVLEVDEFALPLFLKYVDPKIVVLLNISRDQLDRYGETDTILERWHASLKEESKTSLVVDETQKYFDVFDNLAPYKFNDSENNLPFAKGVNDYKNVNAALKVCELLGISKEVGISKLQDYKVAFGRGERVIYEDVAYTVYLAKNPASFYSNLAVCSKSNHNLDYWLILNDNIPDGKDVSWIFDIDTYLLESILRDKFICVSGTRALDMAIRLKYAGLKDENIHIFSSHNEVLNFYKTHRTLEVTVFPNYSAMLEVRKLLTGRNIL